MKPMVERMQQAMIATIADLARKMGHEVNADNEQFYGELGAFVVIVPVLAHLYCTAAMRPPCQ